MLWATGHRYAFWKNVDNLPEVRERTAQILEDIHLTARRDVPAGLDLGEFRLVGAGDIGQAAAHALAVSGVRGTLLVVDDETIALSNLQRYVLTHDADVGAVLEQLRNRRLVTFHRRIGERRRGLDGAKRSAEEQGHDNVGQ